MKMDTRPVLREFSALHNNHVFWVQDSEFVIGLDGFASSTHCQSREAATLYCECAFSTNTRHHMHRDALDVPDLQRWLIRGLHS
jgi:hypothetical protein